MRAQKLLDRLEFYRPTGKSTFLGICPAHNDRSPSLRITQCDDSRVLIHCYAGCGASDILDSLGLKWSDLFPDSENYSQHWSVKKKEQETIEEWVLKLAESDLKAGKRLSEKQKELVKQAKIKRLYSS